MWRCLELCYCSERSDRGEGKLSLQISPMLGPETKTVLHAHQYQIIWRHMDSISGGSTWSPGMESCTVSLKELKIENWSLSSLKGHRIWRQNEILDKREIKKEIYDWSFMILWDCTRNLRLLCCSPVAVRCKKSGIGIDFKNTTSLFHATSS